VHVQIEHVQDILLQQMMHVKHGYQLVNRMVQFVLMLLQHVQL
jgi:hypothetical protein